MGFHKKRGYKFVIAYFLLFVVRWRTLSKSAIPAATDALRELIFPNIGIVTTPSQIFLVSAFTPVSSPPTTIAIAPVRLVS